MYPGFIPHWKRQRCGESRAGAAWEPGERREWRRAWAYGMAGEEELSGLPARLHRLQSARGRRKPTQRELRRKRHRSTLNRGTPRVRRHTPHCARQALSTFADAISGEVFDRAKAEAGAKMRLDSADRLRAAVVTALGRLHELLDPSQRARLAYLIRTGTLSI